MLLRKGHEWMWVATMLTCLKTDTFVPEIGIDSCKDHRLPRLEERGMVCSTAQAKYFGSKWRRGKIRKQNDCFVPSYGMDRPFVEASTVHQHSFPYGRDRRPSMNCKGVSSIVNKTSRAPITTTARCRGTPSQACASRCGQTAQGVNGLWAKWQNKTGAPKRDLLNYQQGD